MAIVLADEHSLQSKNKNNSPQQMQSVVFVHTKVIIKMVTLCTNYGGGGIHIDSNKADQLLNSHDPFSCIPPERLFPDSTLRAPVNEM